MIRKYMALVLVAGTLPLLGCGGGGPQESTIEIKVASGLDRAKSVLERYAQGQPMSSEVEDFPNLIAEVKKEDPQKGAILEKGLNDLKTAKGAALRTKARELLQKL